jgi:tyrosyl-tRNA synthetase
MIPGLLEGQEKMSKSNPDSAIFMEDSEEDVNRKIKQAFCPPKILEGNPCVQYARFFVFAAEDALEVKRKERDGGDITFKTLEEFEEAYTNGSLHPADLKAALAKAVNKKIEPVRRHFIENEFARNLLAEIKSFKVTK